MKNHITIDIGIAVKTTIYGLLIILENNKQIATEGIEIKIFFHMLSKGIIATLFFIIYIM